MSKTVTEHPINGKSTDIPTDVWKVFNLGTGVEVTVVGTENRDKVFELMRIHGRSIATRIAVANNYTMCQDK